MKHPVELLALKQTHEQCLAHADALGEALADMRVRALDAASYEHLDKDDRRLLDQFAYRYTRLQDDMGAKLMPAVLRALGEDIAAMPALDRFARLEQLGWLASADDWATLRQIRNAFAHDYPDSAQERFERLQAAASAASQLMDCLGLISRQMLQRFGDLH
ncbi:hypothetical protein [Rhodoferax antarcticus]|uniref:Uncharacterized protein n=1 Tax=Rhodoferax antarcticus ANT.BR TaxID=1111071 RepID=A0A1Q8YE29_9BURK|nr:hypothetical protein [Rhodoferax antarcticus]APW46135.1 hypothetical protein RA876_06830 [Rhodoferax antarcticus]MCW2310288.1 hypothetical protein [Rhodoferax antarcticus]OLP06314.1 hypothetical protein BLL52_2545 [Rhodoferax antarcticus ANT.BR]